MEKSIKASFCEESSHSQGPQGPGLSSLKRVGACTTTSIWRCSKHTDRTLGAFIDALSLSLSLVSSQNGVWFPPDPFEIEQPPWSQPSRAVDQVPTGLVGPNKHRLPSRPTCQ
jgi:hypothetical protein